MAPSSKNTAVQSRPREKRSRSRAMSPTAPTSTPYLHTLQASLLVPANLSIDALLDKHGSNSTSPPSAQSLHLLHQSIQSQFLPNVRSRSDVCDRSMRELSRKRKLRADQEHDRERHDEERKRARVSKKNDSHRPPAVGAHGLARQDGQDVHKGLSHRPLLGCFADSLDIRHPAASFSLRPKCCLACPRTKLILARSFRRRTPTRSGACCRAL